MQVNVSLYMYVYVCMCTCMCVCMCAYTHLRWLTLCLESGLTAVFPEVVDFVKRQGRMKYVRPLYR